MAKSYVVKAASVLVYGADRGAAVTLARGAQVPVDADPKHVALLLDRGLIEEGEPEGGVEFTPDAQPPFAASTKSDSKKS